MAIATRPLQQLEPYDFPPSGEFLGLAKAVQRWVVAYYEDEAAAFAATVVPIDAMRDATPEMKRAGRCVPCRFLGLWAMTWPGEEPSPHGHIWLFEDGIREEARRRRISLSDQIADTILHEIDHALERDHVLEGLQQAKAEGWWPAGVGRAAASAVPCG